MSAAGKALFLIAGSGVYPRLVLEGARAAGVGRVVVAGFEGETDRELAARADEAVWLRVGQLGALVRAARESGCGEALMAGQIAPGNLFRLRPDWRALMLLARLKERNAESLFGAVAGELEAAGVRVLPATTYMEAHVAGKGHLGGPGLKARQWEDVRFGFRIAKETSRMDIGQSVVVKNGTVLAVEAFEGTDACVKRGGELSGGGGAVLVKVSKPGQDLRFDVPVVGERTLRVAKESGVGVVAVEAGRCLLLDRPRVLEEAERLGVAVCGVGEEGVPG